MKFRIFPKLATPLCLAAILVAFASELQAAILLVPEDYETPGEAMEAAVDGDEIVVFPGTYSGGLYFLGKTVVVRSVAPANSAVVASTILDGGSTFVFFDGTEGSETVLEGFTIRGRGFIGSKGGGVRGNGTVATIRNNIIEDCVASIGGALWDCDGLIEDNIIRNNIAYWRGGGLADCDGLIRGNEITGNLAEGFTEPGGDRVYFPEGGGLSNCYGMITGNYIAHNKAGLRTGLDYVGVSLYGEGGGVSGGYFVHYNYLLQNESTFGGGVAGLSSGGSIVGNLFIENVAASWYASGQFQVPTIAGAGGATSLCFVNHSNNLFYGNVSAIESGAASAHDVYKNNISVANTAPSNPNFTESNNGSEVKGNFIEGWDGDPAMASDLDPRFVDVENGDFRLRPDSPAIDAGEAIGGVAMDIDGNPLPVKSIGFEFRGDGHGYDAGPYEYQGTIEPEDTTLSTLLGILPSYDEQDINRDLRLDIADIVLGLKGVSP